MYVSKHLHCLVPSNACVPRLNLSSSCCTRTQKSKQPDELAHAPEVCNSGTTLGKVMHVSCDFPDTVKA